MNVPVIAGTVSTVLFAASMLPMLIKASRTKDPASYSIGNIVITNVANVVRSREGQGRPCQFLPSTHDSQKGALP